MILEVNKIIVMTTGSYSGYSISGIYKVSRKFDIQLFLDEWQRQNPEEKRANVGFQSWDFLESTVKTGCLERLQVYELHLGDYGPPLNLYLTEI